MEPIYCLFESTNVNASGHYWDGRGTFFKRIFKLFSNFEEAVKVMRERIKFFAETDGLLFDGDGNIKGFDKLCEVLNKYHFEVYHQGSSETYDEIKSSVIISKFPSILQSFFKGRDMDFSVLPEDIDKNQPIIIETNFSKSWEEIDARVVFDNDFVTKSSEMRVPYEIRPMEEDFLPNISTNAFKMDNPEHHYYCRISGQYEQFESAVPFLHIELMKMSSE